MSKGCYGLWWEKCCDVLNDFEGALPAEKMMVTGSLWKAFGCLLDGKRLA
jgi:hypothetical protein